MERNLKTRGSRLSIWELDTYLWQTPVQTPTEVNSSLLSRRLLGLMVSTSYELGKHVVFGQIKTNMEFLKKIEKEAVGA